MYPNTRCSPVELSGFSHLEGVLDVIYNPACTELLQQAKDRNLVAMNGLLMLVAQAKEAAEWFTGASIPDSCIAPIHSLLRRDMENIVLIGMPGSGKSSTGRIVAEKAGKRFVDADLYLQEKTGRSIPEIFASQGENAFRALETQVLQELGKQSGLVIATGGGCVTREENEPLLRQNGTVFCLHRALDKLPADGRPLSQSTRLTEMYRLRKPLYERFADHHIDSDGTVEQAAQQILDIWEEL